jgi:hypothetical protein
LSWYWTSSVVTFLSTPCKLICFIIGLAISLMSSVIFVRSFICIQWRQLPLPLWICFVVLFLWASGFLYF